MLIFAACLAVFVYGMVASMLGTINPGLASKFNLDNVQTGYMALAQGIGLTIASVSVGPLIDRRGKKVGLLLGLGLVGVAMLGLANATGYGMVVGAMLVMGVGGGITLTGANALGSDVSESRRAAVLNFLNVFVGLGGLVTPFVAGNLLAGDSVRVAYGAAFLAIAAFLIHALLKIPAPRPQAGAPVRSGHVFRQPVLYLFASITFLYTACEFGVWNWLPKYLVARGVPEATALTILSSRLRAGPAGWPRGGGAGSDAGFAAQRDSGGWRSHGRANLRDAAHRRSAHGRDGRLLRRPRHGAGVPHHHRDGRQLLHPRNGDGDRFRDHLRFSGLTLSSPVIGWLAGPSPEGIGRGLLVLPAASLAVVAVTLVLRRVSNRRAA
jgi:MFS family permease